MKIAFIPSTFFPFIGGVEVQAHNLANKLTDLGVKVDIFYLDKLFNVNYKYNFKVLNKYLINIVYLLHYYLNLDITILLYFYFKKIIKNNYYDCWHFHSVNYKTLLYIKILKKLNQKIFITFQGADIQIKRSIRYGYRLDKKYDLFLKNNLKFVDKFLSISSEIDSELLKLKVTKNKIYFFPNSVNIEKFDKIKKNKKNKKYFNLITVARNSEKKKGYDLISKVYPELDKKINFNWYIIGKNSTKLLFKENFKKFKNLKIIEEIKNSNENYFPNSKLIKFYKNSDLYINLSRIESFGITFIEAMASGLPIISFDTPGGRVLIKNKKNGLLIKNGDFEKYINAIISQKKNKIDPKPFNKKYLATYDLRHNAASLVDLYSR